MRFAKHPGSAPGATRRTTLSLSASDPELSMEYARLLKVLIYFKESVLCIYCSSGWLPTQLTSASGDAISTDAAAHEQDLNHAWRVLHGLPPLWKPDQERPKYWAHGPLLQYSSIWCNTWIPLHILWIHIATSAFSDSNPTHSPWLINIMCMCAALNIVSFSRGILCGAIQLKEKDGAWIDCKAGPVTMPASPHMLEIDAKETSAVFVLEKVPHFTHKSWTHIRVALIDIAPYANVYSFETGVHIPASAEWWLYWASIRWQSAAYHRVRIPRCAACRVFLTRYFRLSLHNHNCNGKQAMNFDEYCPYADVQTRMLLNRLSTEYPDLPIYGIADWDPYGEAHLHCAIHVRNCLV